LFTRFFPPTNCEGIFRLSGSQRVIREVKQLFDKGAKTVDFGANGAELHAVAGVLKLFFAELTEPIGTFEFYEAWRWASQMKDHEGIVCERLQSRRVCLIVSLFASLVSRTSLLCS
jgi:hypothetical protein